MSAIQSTNTRPVAIPQTHVPEPAAEPATTESSSPPPADTSTDPSSQNGVSSNTGISSSGDIALQQQLSRTAPRPISDSELYKHYPEHFQGIRANALAAPEGVETRHLIPGSMMEITSIRQGDQVRYYAPPLSALSSNSTSAPSPAINPLSDMDLEVSGKIKLGSFYAKSTGSPDEASKSQFGLSAGPVEAYYDSESKSLVLKQAGHDNKIVLEEGEFEVHVSEIPGPGGWAVNPVSGEIKGVYKVGIKAGSVELEGKVTVKKPIPHDPEIGEEILRGAGFGELLDALDLD